MPGLPVGTYRINRDECDYPDHVYDRVANALECAIAHEMSIDTSFMPTNVHDVPAKWNLPRRERYPLRAFHTVSGYCVRVWRGTNGKHPPLTRYIDFPPEREHAISRAEHNAYQRYVPAWAVRDAVESSNSKPARAVSRFVYQNFGVSLDDYDLQNIGAIFANSFSGSFDLLITTGAEGDREDYFNDRSCWWTKYPESRDYLAANGGGAVRAYTLDGDLIGRVWWLPYDGDSLKNGAVLFNAYGIDMLEHIDVWGTIVADALGMKTARTYMYPTTSNNQMYINSKTSVFVGHVTRSPRPGKRFAVQLNLTNPYTGAYTSRLNYLQENWSYCNDCEEHIPDIADRHIRIGDFLYCPKCAQERGLVQITDGAMMGWWTPQNWTVTANGHIYLNDDEHVSESED